MDRGNTYTLTFALIVCLIASTMLTLVSKGLEKKQAFNVEIDRKKNILKAFGHGEKIKKLSQSKINELYESSVEEFFVNSHGDIITPKKVSDKNTDALSVFKSVENGQVKAYAIPIEGYGLWGTLYGYFALEKDLNTVKGITFYKQKETPGLGAEVEKAWFQKNFIGKRILDDQGKFRSVTLVKGKVSDLISKENERKYFVDGISGATITSRGVTKLIKTCLQQYEPYFSSLRGR